MKAMKEDTKILLAVAGFVVLGAVGIAVVGTLSLDRETETVEAVTTAPVREIEATPASYNDEKPLFDMFAPTEATEDPEIEIAESDPAPFEVQEGEDFVARGLETYGAREFDKAAAYFRAAAEERPGRAWTHYMLALSLWKNGELDDAVTEMERSAEIDGGSVKTFVNLSRIENDRGGFEAALTAAEAALVVDPEVAEALFLKGRSLANLDRRDDAIEALDRTLEIEPDNAYARNLLGLTLLEIDRVDEAVEAFRIAAEVAPEVAYIRNNLGMALERAGDSAEAVEAYRVAVSLDPEHDKSAANLARLAPTVIVVDQTETVIAEDAVDESVEIAEATPAEAEPEDPTP